mmetsp:Transcript_44351/g.77911  ORF Transcript_44351/g.77911 Transcript_44351/m.77911 type:complete len:373 (+) Transcript_44351:126-1244(+)
MTTDASALAQKLAQHPDESVLQALHLFDSLRPHLREGIMEIITQEPLKRYTGTLGRFNIEKGFGFISSPEVTAEFGKDAFCSANEVGNYRAGTEVSFTVISNKNGQPQARLVEGPDGKIPQFVGEAPPPQHLGNYSSNQPQWPPAPAHVMPANGEPAAKMRRLAHDQWQGGNASSRYMGTIVSYDPAKNYGFINSAAGTAAYGKDTFVSSMEIGNFQVGDSVSFDIAVNKNGQPQARNLDMGVPTPPPSATTGIPAPPPAVRPAGPTSWRPTPPPAPPAWATPAANHEPWTRGGMGREMEEEQDPRYVGTIHTFNPDKHFGFIQCNETSTLYQKDVFVSDKEIGNFQVGDTISFRVVLNQRGHPQARDLDAA